MPEHFLGIDVGYSKGSSTTGLCLLTIDRTGLKWRCCNTGTAESKRRNDLKELIPVGTSLLGVGIDGPLASKLQIVNRYRSADALLSRGRFQSRCKPGRTDETRGQPLHKHATKLANLIIELQAKKHFTIGRANHPDSVHEYCILETFPNAFLAVLLSDDYQFSNPNENEKKSDLFWRAAIANGSLLRLVQTLAPQGQIIESLDSIKGHDHRAAFICAIAALCVAKNKYVAVGDPEDGQIILPPSSSWGLDSDFQPWAKGILRENVELVHSNQRRFKNHDKARVILTESILHGYKTRGR